MPHCSWAMVELWSLPIFSYHLPMTIPTSSRCWAPPSELPCQTHSSDGNLCPIIYISSTFRYWQNHFILQISKLGKGNHNCECENFIVFMSFVCYARRRRICNNDRMQCECTKQMVQCQHPHPTKSSATYQIKNLSNRTKRMQFSWHPSGAWTENAPTPKLPTQLISERQYNLANVVAWSTAAETVYAKAIAMEQGDCMAGLSAVAATAGADLPLNDVNFDTLLIAVFTLHGGNLSP